MNNNKLSDDIVSFVLNCDDEQLSDLTVTSLARSFNLDRSYISRKFSLQNDFTLAKFILNEKMGRAAVLLKTLPGLTVKELAERLGFFSTHHFRQVFKQHFGISPNKYRKLANRSRG